MQYLVIVVKARKVPVFWNEIPVHLLEVLDFGRGNVSYAVQRNVIFCVLRDDGCMRVSVRPSVRLSVCYHVFSRYVQQDGQKVIPTGSVPHWLYFKNGVFSKNAALESYGVKTK